MDRQFSSNESPGKDWPPKKLSIPTLKAHTSILDVPFLNPVDSSTCSISPQSDRIVDATTLRKCPFILSWSARKILTQSGYDYLQLPAADLIDETGSTPTQWNYDDGPEHPGELFWFTNRIRINITVTILEESSRYSIHQRVKMILSGSSGTWKSYFTRFFVWSLLHPPTGFRTPQTILWICTQNGLGRCLYHLGHIYIIDEFQQFCYFISIDQ